MSAFSRQSALLISLFMLSLLSGCNTDFNFCIVDCKRVVSTSYGDVQGKSNSVVATWYDIPYAAAPEDDNRWRAPQPPAPWQGVLETKYRLRGCQQWAVPTALLDRFTDEDCLTVNVWAPDKPGDHPVMVWFFGGGLLLGSANEPQYMGHKLAKSQDVVVVTVNYRLGPMGFLSLPGLTQEQGQSGNYGFLDQVAALQWVNDEIAAFGGDPDRITLFGESAGGLSVCMHLASPLSRELFDNAIVASGPCGEWMTLNQADADARGLAFAASMGCDQTDAADQLACMRGLSGAQLKDKMKIQTNELFRVDGEDWPFFPYITQDNLFVTDTFENMIAANDALIDSGSLTPQSVILGTVKDEGSLFEALRDHPSAANYSSYLTQRYSELDASDITDVANLYPVQDFFNVGHAVSQIAGDRSIVCPTVKTANTLADAGYPTYHYEFAEYSESVLRKITLAQQGTNPPPLGVFHSGEIGFLFGVLGPTSQLDTDAQKAVSASIQGYMGALAHSGNPNHSDGVAWPQYDNANKAYLVWADGFNTANALRESYCNYWITEDFFEDSL
ncbi:Para-nitrobenzyl esterase [BD1-7 clade bacterium]|uniref:Carboxylic ester hydrolase n=1 Tax=BD1-7 clade bacterium TaxID=2029982 RepID=A0A5S9MSI9_9GAMM|nr:Para-nitrobenzyl esterase [BD1-7 clade bacterium]